ncbi:gluconate:H+ symporter [Hyphomonas sp.]|uniref:GntT/GntP/DsdX family permease n=1 Tax=Hyphomonas sp. TaxID=87 RepID=UPI00391B41E5
MGETASAFVMVAASIAALLGLILRARIPAFLALLLVTVGFGLAYGMEPGAIIRSIQSGMGGTLGFVAVVVGLGAMLGALLESSGGIRALTQGILGTFGEKRTSLSLGFLGFVVAIPVFLDVALIIVAPVLYGLKARTGRPIIAFAIPLLAGLAVSHAFIPPTPGPIAVSDILGADLGWVILLGAVVGLPAMLVAGPVFARWLEGRAGFQDTAPVPLEADEAGGRPVSLALALSVVLIPLVLILAGTLVDALTKAGAVQIPEGLAAAIIFIGHPFSALIIACLFAWIVFGPGRGVPADALNRAMLRGLEPAGVVVLITGAGGAFKQILVDSQAGMVLASALTSTGVSPLFFGFSVAAIVRIAQGSATVAMLTAAGLAAPVAQLAGLDGAGLALMVLAIASCATVLSHVNDSGFWLVSRYLGLSEAQTLRSWTIASTLVGVTGFAGTLVLSLVV